MKELHQLINALNCSQWQALEKFLTCFSSNNKTQAWQLAQLIAKTEKANTTSAEYSKMIYGKLKEAALERLAFNLKHKILDCIVSTTHCTNDEINEDREIAVTKLRRKVLQYNFLSQHMKGLDITRNVLDEIISMSKEYEQYSVLTEHLEFKNWEYNLREGEKMFTQTLKEIEYYEQMKKNYSAAYNYVAQLNILYEFSGKSDEKKIISFLEKVIPEIQHNYLFAKSPAILYYLKVLEMDYQMLMKNYRLARRVVLEMIPIIKSNKSIFTKRRVGTAYDHLATCEMLLGKFDEATECTQRALEFIPEGTYNYALSKQWEFYALFYGKKYNEAEVCANEIIASARKKELGGFRWEKFYFLLANTYFINGKFTEALVALGNKFEIKEDKEGWEFNWRVLQAMANIELSKRDKSAGDKAVTQIEGIRNLFRNNEKRTNFTLRQKNIYRFLSLAQQKGFRFNLLNGKAHNYIELLSSKTEEYGWQILSSELIPFHEWANTKMKKGIKVSVK